MTQPPRHLTPAAARDFELLQMVTRLLPRAVGAERCGIFVHNPYSDTVWTKSGTGIDEREIEVPCEGSIVGRAIKSNRILVAEGLEAANGQHKAVDAATNYVTRNLMCVPIPASGGGTPVGAVEVLNKLDGPFTEEDQRLVTEVARDISLGLERFYLSQDVESQLGRLRRRSQMAQLLAMAAMGLCLVLVAVILLAG